MAHFQAKGCSLLLAEGFTWRENTRENSKRLVPLQVARVSSLRDENGLPEILCGDIILERTSTRFRVLLAFLLCVTCVYSDRLVS